MTANFAFRLRAVVSALTSAALLAACGGGNSGSAGSAGGTNSTALATESSAASSNLIIQAISTFTARESVKTPTRFSDSDSARLLTQATFGPTLAEITRTTGMGATAWLDEQLAMPYTASRGHLAFVRAREAAGEPAHQNQFYQSFWKQAVTAPDQLRLRTAFALSEIFVVSYQSGLADEAEGVASYMDMLGERSFGTYRDLLEAVARHPMMGIYLSHLGNLKEDPVTGRVPDENFAREVLQLFSIGLYQLNADGSQKLDANGKPIETYTNADVQGLAKVFTGFSWAGPDKTPNRFYGWPGAVDANSHVTAMQGYPTYHSTSEKKFLGTTVAAQSSANPDASLKAALDTIAAHPNVAPFMSRQLIERLVTSNPSPSYIARVAAVFNDNGSGVRGDMKAVVRAVLTDNEARSAAVAATVDYGKVKEPILRVTAWLRAFGATSISGLYKVPVTNNAATSLNQAPLDANSVFNFFRPAYVPLGGAIAADGLMAPEMQISDEVSVAGYVNSMVTSVMWGFGLIDVNGHGDMQADYSREVGLVSDPETLLAELNKLLFAGQMPDTLKTQIIQAMANFQTGDTPDAVAMFKMNRVQFAVLLCVVSPEYIVQK